MNYNKVVLDGETILDISEDTVSPETLLEGETAHDSSGKRIQGKASPSMPNTRFDNGYVEKGNGNPNKYWGTDQNGNPMWMPGDAEDKIVDHNNDKNAHYQIRKQIVDLKNEFDNMDNNPANKVDKSDIVDNLTSEDVNKPLSANMGRFLRGLITVVENRLNSIADSDDETLDQLSEIVSYIKNNKSLIDGVTTTKVNVSDIVNDLYTEDADKPLSAEMGAKIRGGFIRYGGGEIKISSISEFVTLINDSCITTGGGPGLINCKVSGDWCPLNGWISGMYTIQNTYDYGGADASVLIWGIAKTDFAYLGYLTSDGTEENSNAIWNKIGQAQDLDMSNFITKDGGVMTGPFYFTKGTGVYQANHDIGEGYAAIATITTTKDWQTSPIVIEMTGRGSNTSCIIYIGFQRSVELKPPLRGGLFLYESVRTENIYMAMDEDTGVWTLYYKKFIKDDVISVLRYHKPEFDDGLEVNFNVGGGSVSEEYIVDTLNGIKATPYIVKQLNGTITEYPFTNTELQGKNIVQAIDATFQLGSERKNEIVAKLTAAGISASNSSTWNKIIEDIGYYLFQWKLHYHYIGNGGLIILPNAIKQMFLICVSSAHVYANEVVFTENSEASIVKMLEQHEYIAGVYVTKVRVYKIGMPGNNRNLRYTYKEVQSSGGHINFTQAYY